MGTCEKNITTINFGCFITDLHNRDSNLLLYDGLHDDSLEWGNKPNVIPLYDERLALMQVPPFLWSDVQALL